MNRPNLEGLFNGSTAAEPPKTAPIGRPIAPQAPASEPAGLFDPVALAERYFAVLQTLLDMQREFGMRVAHQIADLPGMERLRR